MLEIALPKAAREAQYAISRNRDREPGDLLFRLRTLHPENDGLIVSLCPLRDARLNWWVLRRKTTGPQQCHDPRQDNSPDPDRRPAQPVRLDALVANTRHIEVHTHSLLKLTADA